MREKHVSMIDITPKKETEREAVAYARIRMNPETLKLIKEGKLIKGDVLTTAEIAGIMAAKKTPYLLPLCHPLLLTNVKVEFDLPDEGNSVEVTATAKGIGKTGMEMEALVAASISVLTIYDMCKGVDKDMTIEEVYLLRKGGGKSGMYIAPQRKARLVAICLSPEKGTKKEPIAEGWIEEGKGLSGDAHAGGIREVSLLAIESIQKARRQGMKLNPGDSAENLVTSGIDLMALPLGTKLHIGNEVIIEVTQIGKEYHRGDFKLLPEEGIFARVIQGGLIKVGDDMRIGRDQR
jgi:cyclic pyranopterin phosphate synthase